MVHCRGKGFIELPIGSLHKEFSDLVIFARIAIASPRYTAKSSWFCKFYPLYCALENEGCKVMIVSAGSTLAEEHLSALKNDLLLRPTVRQMYGDQVTKAWRQDEVKLKNGSVISAKGAGKQIRGFHPDIVIVDDIETDEIVANPDTLKKLEHWFWTDLYGTIPRHGQIVVIGTILHPESFLSALVHKPPPGWATRFYSAIKADGKALWPEMWPIEHLERVRLEIGDVAFRQEYMNDPMPDELRKFQRKWIKYFEKEPEGCHYFTTVDPAIEVGNANDFTAIVTCAVDAEENVYVVNVINKRLLPSELIDAVFNEYDLYKSQVIGIETVGFQKLLKYEIDKQKTMRRKYPVVAELKSEGRRKALRIEALQPRFECGKIFIKKSQSDLETQLLRFPSPRCKDDVIDALAYQLEIIRPSDRPIAHVNPESFMAEIERRRASFAGRTEFWGNHKLMRQER